MELSGEVSRRRVCAAYERRRRSIVTDFGLGIGEGRSYLSFWRNLEQVGVHNPRGKAISASVFQEAILFEASVAQSPRMSSFFCF